MLQGEAAALPQGLRRLRAVHQAASRRSCGGARARRALRPPGTAVAPSAGHSRPPPRSRERPLACRWCRGTSGPCWQGARAAITAALAFLAQAAGLPHRCQFALELHRRPRDTADKRVERFWSACSPTGRGVVSSSPWSIQGCCASAGVNESGPKAFDSSPNGQLGSWAHSRTLEQPQMRHQIVFPV